MDGLENWFSAFILDQLKASPFVGLWVLLMGCDVVSGTIVAAVNGKMNSTFSLEGAGRKIHMVLFVAIGAVMEPLAQGLPTTNLIAAFYCWTEGISLIENSVKLGLPVPKVLRDALDKLRGEGTVLKVPAQEIVVVPVKRPPSDFVELGTGPPKKDTADSEGGSQPSRPD